MSEIVERNTTPIYENVENFETYRPCNGESVISEENGSEQLQNTRPHTPSLNLLLPWSVVRSSAVDELSVKLKCYAVRSQLFWSLAANQPPSLIRSFSFRV